jgi:hypothetical protein
LSDPRPSLVSGLTGNTVVFRGLIIAGTTSFLSSDSFPDEPLLVRIGLILSLFLALIGCAASLLSHIQSVNWAKRTVQEGNGTPLPNGRKADDAKALTLIFANSSFIALFLATIAIGATIAVRQMSLPATNFSREAASVIGSDGVPLLRVDGGIEVLHIRRVGNECEIELKTDRLKVRARRALPCSG